MALLRGIDGCRGGWLCVDQDTHASRLDAWIATSFEELVQRGAVPAAAAIDVPIGLPERGARACDVAARRLLAGRRGSVFPAPVRAAVSCATYAEACRAHRAADGHALSKQTWAIVRKIREVDRALRVWPALRRLYVEVHPEVSFALWNGGRPLAHGKKSAEGRRERERLIEAWWPGARAGLAARLPPGQYAADDLNDTFAALWSAERVASGRVVRLPARIETDGLGVPMQILA